MTIPDTLKTPKEYLRIEKTLKRIMVSDHAHAKVSAFLKCKRCKAKLDKRREFIKKEGFADFQEYLRYRNIMQTILRELHKHENTAKNGK